MSSSCSSTPASVCGEFTEEFEPQYTLPSLAELCAASEWSKPGYLGVAVPLESLYCPWLPACLEAYLQLPGLLPQAVPTRGM